MIDVAELRCVLGSDGSVSQLRRVDSIHASVCQRIKKYARDAPVEVRNEAVILMAGWIWQATAQSRRIFPDDGGRPINTSRAFLLSGAQGLLSPWHRPRAGKCVS